MIHALIRTTDSITLAQFLVDRKKTHRSEIRKTEPGGLFERPYTDSRNIYLKSSFHFLLLNWPTVFCQNL